LKNILVTGGTGFIGRNLINLLIKKKVFKIFSTYRSDSVKRPKNVYWIKVQSLDKFNFETYNFDILIDLAWYDLDNYNAKSHLHRQVKEHLVFYKKLLNKNKNINIYTAGTCLEYGLAEGKLLEKTVGRPIVNYAIGKNNLKKKIFELKKKYNFGFNWLRFFYIYGKGQEQKKLYTIFTQAIKKKHKYFKMSNGNQSRDYLNIDKITNLLFELILKDQSNGVINICSGRPSKVIDLIRGWKKQLNSKIILKRNIFSIPKHESFSFYGCNKKLKGILKKI
jgi:nucleoside-diphosphate-sugar epimerase